MGQDEFALATTGSDSLLIFIIGGLLLVGAAVALFAASSRQRRMRADAAKAQPDRATENALRDAP